MRISNSVLTFTPLKVVLQEIESEWVNRPSTRTLVAVPPSIAVLKTLKEPAGTSRIVA